MNKVSAIITFSILLAFVGIVRADYASVDECRTLNSNYSTFQIRDSNGGGANSGNIFNVYNNLFGLKKGDEGYFSSSNDLYQSIGVQQDVLWNGTDARIYSLYTSASQNSTFSIKDENGQVLSSMYRNDIFGDNYNAANWSGTWQNNLILDNLNGAFNFELYATGNGTFSSDSQLNTKGTEANMIHTAIFDITSQMMSYFTDMGWDIDFETAYMLGWEDRSRMNPSADFDYNDLMFIAFDIKPSDNTTPEPATILLFGVGMVALPILRKLQKRRSR